VTTVNGHEAAPPAALRRERILDAVRRQDFASVADLSEVFRVSEVTVRSDLAFLERRGKLRRVRGGAMAHAPHRHEQPFEETSVAAAEQKALIGAAAATMVSSGETIILDVGSTAAATAQALVQRDDLADVVVFTNGLNIALSLEPAGARITVVVTGGTLRPLQHSLVNPLGTLVLSEINARTVFLGCNGVDAVGGITNINLPEAEVKRQMLRSAARRVVLADGSKIGAVSLAHLCRVEDVDTVLTDQTADAGAVAALEERGVDVQVVDAT